MDTKYNPTDIEAKWYKYWLDNKLFHSEPDGREPFTVVIPPPNVTGVLHMGHVLNETIQDILVRRARQEGKNACWVPGTDHASIATEAKVIKRLAEQGIKKSDLTREEFLKHAWAWTDEHGGIILKQLRTLGCSCDWDRTAFTMDETRSKAVIDVFCDLYRKGLIYRGLRMVNWDPERQTALSDEEVIYHDEHSHLYYLKYYVQEQSEVQPTGEEGEVVHKDEKGYYAIVATTRPETIMGDVAMCINPKDPKNHWLRGKHVIVPKVGRVIPVIEDRYVEIDFGTGCLKVTPAHDVNDYALGQKYNLEAIDIFTPDAHLSEAAGLYVGMDRFACREQIVKDLKAEGLLEKVEDYDNKVGYSERGGVPIETLVSAQWFCKMGELAKPAIEAVKSGKIKFYPERWTKTYFHWMENIQDWCISRQLWWGHRIPAWYNDETNEVYVGVDAPTAPGKWRQEEDVLDTWFSSWLWPFSIMGWPEKTEELKRFYPTNDLVTGPDIIFFWVARMIMAGEEFMGDIPFRNVYFTSIIRDEKGRKLSKSLGNSPDPLEVIAEYGADALRFSIVYIAPVGLDIKYSNEKCEIGRNFANKLWNACRFRQMQGDVTDFARKLPEVELSADEKWMLAKLDAAVATIEDELKKFRFHTAAHALYDLVWSDFCDWFVEAEKRPFRAGGADRDRALAVLDCTLFTILKLLHPFMPFITEELAHRMGFVDADGTLMYEEFPKPGACGKYASDPVIPLVEGKFELVRGGRFLRSSCNIADGKKLNFHIKAASPESLAFLNGELESLKLLLNAEKIDLSLDAFDSAANGAAPKQVCQQGVISLPLAGLIDVAAEKVKLEKQLKELDGWIRGTEAKLANEKFLKGAPPQVVADAKSKLAELVERRERTIELLNDLN